jgi:hypothetical protein
MDNNTVQIAMAASQRTADVVYNRFNGTIISVENLLPPVPETIAPGDLLSAFQLFFGEDVSNPDTNSSNSQFIQFVADTFYDSTASTAREALSGLLTVPLLYLQENGFNPYWNTTLPGQLESGLSPGLYIDIDLSQTLVVAVIPVWTVIVYAIASLIVFFWCVGGMLLALSIQSPPSSGFDLIDFTSRVTSNHDDSSLSSILGSLSNGKTKVIRKNLESETLLVRDVGLYSRSGGRGTGSHENYGKVGFALNDKVTTRLDGGQLYE